MGLEQRVFDALKALAPCRLLSLGYPDLLLTEKLDVPEVADAKQIAAWHLWDGPVYETDAALKLFGIDATYIDIRASRGCERILDMNIDIDWTEPKFDVVLDPGTLEHCFNVAQAFWNVRKLCNPGGHIIHSNPVNMVNHGFWNFSPTAYLDFYSHHGDKVIKAEMLSGPLNAREVYELPPIVRFTPPANATALVVAKRGVKWGPGWPLQTKYRIYPDLKK